MLEKAGGQRDNGASLNGDSPGQWARAYPELGTGPLSFRPFVDPKYFELEQTKIFAKSWLHICRIEELQKPGDYVIKNLQLFKTSVLIVRGADGRLRAFHNICRHRGNKLVPGTGGCAKSFMCEFHGWVYSTEGKLLNITDKANHFTSDAAALSLPEISVDEWEGFVFIHLDPKPPMALKEFLGDIVDLLAGYPFGKYSHLFGYQAEVNCNWKLSVNAQQEGYHAPYLHRRSLGNSLAWKDNPDLHMLHFGLHGKHRYLSMPGNPDAGDVQRGPVDTLAAKFGPSIRTYNNAEGKLAPGVNPTGAKNWAADIFVIYPNFWVTVFSHMYQTFSWWPLAADRSIIRTDMHGTPPKTLAEQFAVNYNAAMSRDTWLEDLGTLEESQTVIGGGAISEYYLQDQEILCRHFMKVIDDDVRA